MQALLGRLHDLQVLADRVRHVQASLGRRRDARRSWRELDGLVSALEDDCRRLHARYVRERDGLLDLCERLSARARLRRPGRRRVAGRRAESASHHGRTPTSCISFDTAWPKSAATRGPTTRKRPLSADGMARMRKSARGLVNIGVSSTSC